MAAAPTVVLDCRWLGISGAGRATELVLRGLGAAAPPGRWILWGAQAKTASLAWPGAEVVPTEPDPRRLWGQRDALAVPPGDFSVFMHQQRPLRRFPAATFVYDTIAVRHGSVSVARQLKRLFLRRVARISDPVITISRYSKACIVEDLGVSADRVEVVHLPFDDAFVERVSALRRAGVATEEVALFIGAFLPHKNVPRLLSAFAESEFCRRGGQLVVVVATADQAEDVRGRLDGRQREAVTVRHSCAQAEVDRLYATSRFLVQPSLEEGFGLPAWEAMCCGLPVCVSDGGALPEVTEGFAEPFPARSVAAMAAAIDACAAVAAEAEPEEAVRRSGVVRDRAPTVRDFGLQVAELIGQAAGSRR